VLVKEKDARFKTDRKLIMYVEKKDGAYRPIETGSYMIETHFDDFIEKRKSLKENYSNKLKNGEISPIEYYRVLINISIADLATRVGLSSRKVKKHLKPGNFKSIRVDVLKRYADVFRIPVANMFQLLENSDTKRKLEQILSQNPLIVTTTIREDNSAKN
jgi:transcriptional regulator with XRE-family HTH domain